MEAFLKPPNAKEIDVLFAHNDDMALGAIQVMEEAGIKPGQDIKIVSIDGVRAHDLCAQQHNGVQKATELHPD